MAVKFGTAGGSSNKPHTNEIAYGWGTEGYIALIPKIDKLSFTYNVPPKHHDPIKANLAGLNSAPWQYAKLISPYTYARALVHEATGEKIIIHAVPKKHAAFMRFDCNPAKLGPEGIEFLKERLLEVFFDEYPWDHIAINCNVTRMDLAVDLLGVKTADLLVGKYKPGSAKSKPLKRMFVVSPEGTLETVYVGNKPAKVRVYNKALELVEQQKLPPTFGNLPHTRVEMLTTPLRSITELLKMENPFTKIAVHNLNKNVTPPDGPHNWTFFLDCCRIRGAEAALALLPSEELRDAYRKALTDAELPSWQPERLWKKMPAVLKASGLLPEN